MREKIEEFINYLQSLPQKKREEFFEMNGSSFPASIVSLLCEDICPSCNVPIVTREMLIRGGHKVDDGDIGYCSMCDTRWNLEGNEIK